MWQLMQNYDQKQRGLFHQQHPLNNCYCGSDYCNHHKHAHSSQFYSLKLKYLQSLQPQEQKQQHLQLISKKQHHQQREKETQLQVLKLWHIGRNSLMDVTVADVSIAPPSTANLSSTYVNRQNIGLRKNEITSNKM